MLSESVDLPKTFNTVYGIGPGTALDAEIHVFMKSKGWSERIQVGMLMGDMMETLENKVQEHNKAAGQLPSVGNVAGVNMPISSSSINQKVGV